VQGDISPGSVVFFLVAVNRRFSASAKGDSASKLSRVYQLTGFADPVYCEAMLTGEC
jgi:hypothetical protein